MPVAFDLIPDFTPVLQMALVGILIFQDILTWTLQSPRLSRRIWELTRTNHPLHVVKI